MGSRLVSGYFKQTPEYELLRRSPLVRFRPHRPMTEESRRVALPLARLPFEGSSGRDCSDQSGVAALCLRGLNLGRRAQLDSSFAEIGLGCGTRRVQAHATG